jgi:LmbE family N-acetylglucosaminyl deacetylase
MLQDLFEQATLPEDSATPAPASMLVFSHPDDEVVAVGARLGRFRSGLFVHVTDGAPRNEQDSRAHGFATLDEYRRCREEELSRALHMAGVPDAQRVHLSIPDQEASFRLAQLTKSLRRLLIEHRIEVVFTHPYEGGHPDHDACAFAVHRAVRDIGRNGTPSPMIVESAFYHAAPHGIETECFLPHAEKTAEIHRALSPEEKRRKQVLLACFTSQQRTLSCFANDCECFRIAPQYDFYKPPHNEVFYEHFPWGMTARQFCDLARAADVLEGESGALCE